MFQYPKFIDAEQLEKLQKLKWLFAIISMQEHQYFVLKKEVHQ